MTDLPSGWAKASLAEVAEVRLGRQRSPKTHHGDNMRPYLRAANITWPGLSLDDVKEMHFSPTEVETYRLVEGDILVAEASGSRSEVGKPALWGGEIAECCFQNTLLRVRSRGPLSKYLLYLLRLEALAGRLGDAARGVGIHHLGAAGLSSYVVHLAPLMEQKRIVGAIEEQFSRLDRAEASLRLAEHRSRLMRSSLLESTWATGANQVPLREVTEITTGSTPSIAEPAFWGGRVPFVTPGDLEHCGIVKGTARTLTEEGLRKARLCNAGSVLLTCIGATIGKASRTRVPCATNQQINTLTAVSEALDAKYMLYTLCAPSGQKAILEASSSTTLPILNKSRLGRLAVPLPPIPLQQQVVAKIDHHLSLLASVMAAIGYAHTQSGRLRLAILECAFSGRLVPRGPRDEAASELLARITTGPATAKESRRRSLV